MIVGPDSLGQFTTTHIRSIERKRIPVAVCSAGQSASFALKRVRRKEVRKGMVVLPKLDTPPKVYREFVAEGTCQLCVIEMLTHNCSFDPESRDDHQDKIPSDAPRGTRVSNMCHY